VSPSLFALGFDEGFAFDEPAADLLGGDRDFQFDGKTLADPFQ
jgi:hypothetical protein